jgi:hypothetical protein
MLGYLLIKMGVLDINFTDSGLDIKFHEEDPIPSPAQQPSEKKEWVPITNSEVFYVSGNDYTYDDAKAVCVALNSTLASYDQVNEAYLAGAEWCGYGWSQGGMALFPTQTTTWEALQGETDIAKRTQCGHPGVNGGYFDPANKFGVNCYGIKPENKKKITFPQPLPNADPGFNDIVSKFKGMVDKMNVSGFNRYEWSESTNPKITGNFIPSFFSRDSDDERPMLTTKPKEQSNSKPAFNDTSSPTTTGDNPSNQNMISDFINWLKKNTYSDTDKNKDTSSSTTTGDNLFNQNMISDFINWLKKNTYGDSDTVKV